MSMTLKKCSRCKNELPLTEFSSNRTKFDGKTSTCKSCKKIYQDSWYAKNKQAHITHVTTIRKTHVKLLRQQIWEYFKTHVCVDCGESDPIVLEFDHVREGKIKEVSLMVTRGWSWLTILREIEKCEVRCANCHKRRTAKQRGYYKELWQNGNAPDS